ncbi:hypothetical protein [Streptomyces lydicus]|uniref:hypothetical protein n=1 Tax=Streptomyces lydicus TaxID=47763 RepID=UPI001010D7CF|nr:hypothetical protein [Streptomyces lydicus]MCZ1009937.1 hypothetical protein [Streptomyces lydicus]
MRLTTRDRLRYLAAKVRYRRQTIIPGAFRISVRRTPLGAELDVSDLVESLVRQLAENYADDPEGIDAELARIAELGVAAENERHLDGAGYAEHERDSLVEQFVDEMGGARMRIGGAIFTILPETVRALVDEREGSAR